jgi:drug/metabolite transporter (DMT)-like permease
VPAGRASVFTNIVPVIAVGVAYVVLGERFTAGQALAAVVLVTRTPEAAARSRSAG